MLTSADAMRFNFIENPGLSRRVNIDVEILTAVIVAVVLVFVCFEVDECADSKFEFRDTLAHFYQH